MTINIISFSLRGVGLVGSGIGAFVLEAGQSLGTLIFGALAGILIWSILDLMFGFFQDRPTQGVNSGTSLVSSLIGIPYFQYTGLPILLLGLVIGFVVAIVLDWKTKT